MFYPPHIPMPEQHLMAALKSGAPLAARAALVAGARLDWAGGYNISDGLPLHIAARMGDEHMVRLLLRNGACPFAKGRARRLAAHEAAQAGHVGCVRVLLDFAPWDALGFSHTDMLCGQGLSLAFMAATQNNLDMLKLLASRDADLDIAAPNGTTPLLAACKAGHLAAAAFLLQEPTKAGLADDNGVSPLLELAQRGAFELIKILAAKNTPYPKPDALGRTPIAVAKANGHHELANFLIEYAAPWLPPTPPHACAVKVRA